MAPPPRRSASQSQIGRRKVAEVRPRTHFSGRRAAYAAKRGLPKTNAFNEGTSARHKPPSQKVRTRTAQQNARMAASGARSIGRPNPRSRISWRVTRSIALLSSQWILLFATQFCGTLSPIRRICGHASQIPTFFVSALPSGEAAAFRYFLKAQKLLAGR